MLTVYDELVKRLRSDADYMDGEGIALFAAPKFYRECADAIEEQSLVLESYRNRMKAGCDWIPVTERLPERRRWVLCRCQANITEVMRFENAEWYHDPSHVYFFEFVTHWMPLPDPPKKEPDA